MEPENRLVCRTLEAEWEQKLRAHRELQEEYDRFLESKPRILTQAEQDAIRRLATDLPALWHATTTTDSDRKAILRQILDKVVIQIEGKTEWVEVWLHWVGGHQTYTRIRRPVAKLIQLSEWPQLQQRILALKADGRTAREIAEQLNREGKTSPHGKAFTAPTIRAAICRCGLTQVPRGAGNEQLVLAENEWFVPDLAHEFGVSRQVIYSRMRKGQLPSRQVGGPQGRWIVRADAAMLESIKTASEQRSNSRAQASTIDNEPNAHHRRDCARVTGGIL